MTASGTTDWISIPGGSFAIGLTREEALALARTTARAAHQRVERDPDPLHAMRQADETADMDGNLSWLVRQLLGAFPAHTVQLAPYRIAARPVTNAEYKPFVAAKKAAAPAAWKFPGGNADERPVTGISWDDAHAFAQFAGARLPTEAEWERAARGEARFLFPWGNDYNPTGARLEQESMHARFAPGKVPGLASPDGVLDLVTRYWEWCSDAFALYPGADPAIAEPLHQAKPGYRVRRGGELERLVASAVNRDGSRPGFAHTAACVRLAQSG